MAELFLLAIKTLHATCCDGFFKDIFKKGKSTFQQTD